MITLLSTTGGVLWWFMGQGRGQVTGTMCRLVISMETMLCNMFAWLACCLPAFFIASNLSVVCETLYCGVGSEDWWSWGWEYVICWIFQINDYSYYNNVGMIISKSLSGKSMKLSYIVFLAIISSLLEVILKIDWIWLTCRSPNVKHRQHLSWGHASCLTLIISLTHRIWVILQ